MNGNRGGKPENPGGSGRDKAPGLQRQIEVPNTTDPNAQPWKGTKAEYLKNKESLKAQGYILPEDEEGEDEGEEGTVTG